MKTACSLFFLLAGIAWSFAGPVEKEIEGIWRIASTSGWFENREFRSDGTYIRLAKDLTTNADGSSVHKWKITGNEVVLETTKDERERLLLPIDPKGTNGFDATGREMKATKLPVNAKGAASTTGSPVSENPVGSDEPLYAIPVPGKMGFVRSPYAEGKSYIDVRGMPKDTKVKDPHTQKVFLVP